MAEEEALAKATQVFPSSLVQRARVQAVKTALPRRLMVEEVEVHATWTRVSPSSLAPMWAAKMALTVVWALVVAVTWVEVAVVWGLEAVRHLMVVEAAHAT